MFIYFQNIFCVKTTEMYVLMKALLQKSIVTAKLGIDT